MDEVQQVLFTSVAQPIGGCSPNVYGWDKQPATVKVAMNFLNHPGLAFLKANLTCSVLEYPTWSQFAERIAKQPPKILGISFHINESEQAVRMARYARSHGVQELWAGNYGTYCPEVRAHFDRSITGWGESKISQLLGGKTIENRQIVHPPIYASIGTSLFNRSFVFGLLYTSRGCPYSCSFCQTPDFYGQAHVLSLEAIERVLATYHQQGITGVNVLDENFGIFPKHASEVVNLLRKYRMSWVPLSRVETVLKHFDQWREQGMVGAHLGVESLNQDSLTSGNKRLNQEKSIELLRKMSKHNLFVQAFYIIGFEDETVETIERDLRKLLRLDVDIAQVQVITPYPKTELAARIETEFGIQVKNYSKFNSRNLVWNHPRISPEEMRLLQSRANKMFSTTRRSLRTLSKLMLFQGHRWPNPKGLWQFGKSLGRSHLRLRSELEPKLSNAQKWADVGWYPYEEVDDHEVLVSRQPSDRRAQQVYVGLPVVSNVEPD
jgi:radical SAM superfamily enzyme YgiQ (UPF0313 family)